MYMYGCFIFQLYGLAGGIKNARSALTPADQRCLIPHYVFLTLDDALDAYQQISGSSKASQNNNNCAQQRICESFPFMTSSEHSYMFLNLTDSSVFECKELTANGCKSVRKYRDLVMFFKHYDAMLSAVSTSDKTNKIVSSKRRSNSVRSDSLVVKYRQMRELLTSLGND